MISVFLRGRMVKRINIGAGKFRKDGWTNIDHASSHYFKNKIDIDIDLLGEYYFPIQNGSVIAAYSSHVIEHLTESSVQKMMAETYRVLSPGGFFRITCPDARAALDALVCDNDEFFNIYDSSPCFNSGIPGGRYHLAAPLSEASIYQKFLYSLAPQRCIHVDVPCEKITDRELQNLIKNTTPDMVLDYIISEINEDVRKNNPWMHISWWSIQKLKSFMKDAGFKKIYQSQPGLSSCGSMCDLNNFDWSLPKLSLYIEAVK